MPIVFDEKKRVFKLDTPNTTYAFHVTNSNHLIHLYYGASIPETDITHMMLSARGMASHRPVVFAILGSIGGLVFEDTGA